MNATASEASKPNRHIFDYLEYYASLPQTPRYAVLVSGAWGIGKTFVVKSFLRDHYTLTDQEERAEYRRLISYPPEGPSEKKRGYLYLSLFGLRTIEELNTALLIALHPWSGTQTAVVAGHLIQAGLKYAKIDIKFSAKDLLRKPRARMYIFDDLERTDIDQNQILGYINQFVEHDNCKVIIIANERELQKDPSYKERKEKLIGKTLNVQPTFGLAYDYFVGALADGSGKDILRRHKDSVEEVFNQSEMGNLRVLQQTIWDFVRFLAAMTAEQRENDHAVIAILKLFFAMSFEVKAGTLEQADINSRTQSLVEFMKTRETGVESRMASISKKYVDVQMDDTVVPNDILVDVLFKGLVDDQAIQKAVGESSYFESTNEEPAWQTVWHALERPLPLVKSAIARLNDQLKNREIVVPGEIMQAAGLLLWQRKIGLIDESAEEIVAQMKSYIDDVKRSGRLTNVPDHHDLDAYASLIAHEHESAEYRELAKYLELAGEQAERESYPSKGQELLEIMRTDPMMFFRRISNTQSSDNTYAYVPVLAAIPPAEFVKNFFALTEANQRDVFRGLRNRYAHGAMNNSLEDERAWTTEVARLMRAKVNESDPVERWRVDLLLKWLDP